MPVKQGWTILTPKYSDIPGRSLEGLMLPEENAWIKKQLAAALEEKRMLLGRLHEIETQLNADQRLLDFSS